MTPHQIRIKYLVKKLRYKYSHPSNPSEAERFKRLDSVLTNVLWHSYYVVYTNAEHDDKVILAHMKKRAKAKWRYNRRIREMATCYDSLYFVTLTFSDESLSTISDRTAHRYVQAWLNENCHDYLANEDFGAKNGRLHYHAVIAKKEALEEWKYGFWNIKRIKFTSESSIPRISSYMLKLVNHGNKLTTGKSFSKRGMKVVDNLPF